MLGFSIEETVGFVIIMIVSGIWSYTMKKMDDCIRAAKEQASIEHDKRLDKEHELEILNNYMASLLNVPGVMELFHKALDEIPEEQDKLRKETENLKSDQLTCSNNIAMNTTCIEQLEDTREAVRYALSGRCVRR
jgi:hypothetical protein